MSSPFFRVVVVVAVVVVFVVVVVAVVVVVVVDMYFYAWQKEAIPKTIPILFFGLTKTATPALLERLCALSLVN